MELPNITDLLFQGRGILIFKVPILVLLLLYTLFTFIVISRIRALNRTVSISASHASGTLQTFAFVQFLLALSLFLISLVIV